MAERLTKAVLKDEIARRIEWFEKNYDFNSEHSSMTDMVDNPNKLMMYGRYLALTEVRYQIDGGLFIGGFAC